MNDSPDLRDLLADWPFDPEHDARIVRGGDGREILQVRTPLGIEQLEMDGRPDGARPYGMESALEYHLQRLARARAAGREADFEVSAEDCAELFGEGTLYYFRYLRLFQLKRWAGAVRDTARNLRLFDFARRHAGREEDRIYLEKWRPYILRINASASAMMALEKGAYARALQITRAGLERIEALEPMDDETFAFEQNRSATALRELASQIEKHKPVSRLESLERQLRKAIETQAFERAAQIRDHIRDLKSPKAAKSQEPA